LDGLGIWGVLHLCDHLSRIPITGADTNCGLLNPRRSQHTTDQHDHLLRVADKDNFKPTYSDSQKISEYLLTNHYSIGYQANNRSTTVL